MFNLTFQRIAIERKYHSHLHITSMSLFFVAFKMGKVLCSPMMLFTHNVEKITKTVALTKHGQKKFQYQNMLMKFIQSDQ